MSRFREGKTRLAAICASDEWRAGLALAAADAPAARQALNPLLSLLSRPEARLRAAYGLGLAVARIAEVDKEAARVVMRRLMWSLNEESGNLGWGVPEAMGSILAASPALAAEYARIFLSYGYETGKDDNFLEYAPLRRGVYWGIGRLAGANPEAARPALPHLITALRDADRPVRGMAAFALEQLALKVPDRDFASGEGRRAWQAAAEALRRAADEQADSPAHGGNRLELFDGREEKTTDVAEMLGWADAIVRQRLAETVADTENCLKQFHF